MQTDTIRIDNSGKGLEKALSETERVASYLKMDKKEALRLRLLTEEALGMVYAAAGTFHGSFYIEASENRDCRLHIETDEHIDFDTKQELISVSSSGKNESEKSFMGKLFSLMERGMHDFEEVNRLQIEYGGTPLMFGSLGVYETGSAAIPGVWSLAVYRENLQAEMEKQDMSSETMEEAFDELEKSIVASIADDVKVTVKSNHAEIVIEKQF